jgi:hypothetical protein
VSPKFRSHARARSKPSLVALGCAVAMTLATPVEARRSDPRASTAQGAVTWPDEASSAGGQAVPLAVRPTSTHIDGPEDVVGGQAEEAGSSVPRPQALEREPLTVAVGLSPEAPGSKRERELLERLAASAQRSTRPPTHVRRLRPGAGDARRICRERRDDLVIMIGYLPERDDPVVLAHDCKLDMALNVRGIGAVDEAGLVGALWDEHDELVRQGVSERRRLMRLGPRARAGIIGGVAGVVVAVAIGLLVANALRDERVVLTVRP